MVARVDDRASLLRRCAYGYPGFESLTIRCFSLETCGIVFIMTFPRICLFAFAVLLGIATFLAATTSMLFGLGFVAWAVFGFFAYALSLVVPETALAAPAQRTAPQR